MRPVILNAITLVVTLSLTPAAGRGQSPLTTHQHAMVDSSLRLMQSDSWQNRSEGFYQLFRAELPGGLNGASAKIPPTLLAMQRDVPDRAADLTTSLINLLGRENAYSRSAGRTTEAFSSYHGDLIFAVAYLRDRRALAPLLEVLDTGALATRGVARLGANAALAPLLTLATVTADGRRNAVTQTLGDLVDPTINPEPLTPGQRDDIKAALVRATSDNNPFIRTSAVVGIARLPDPDVTQLLRLLAESDPYSIQPGGSGDAAYPVREAAERALAARR
jgi:hypothetical protein